MCCGLGSQNPVAISNKAPFRLAPFPQLPFKKQYENPYDEEPVLCEESQYASEDQDAFCYENELKFSFSKADVDLTYNIILKFKAERTTSATREPVQGQMDHANVLKWCIGQQGYCTLVAFLEQNCALNAPIRLISDRAC